MQRGGTVGVEKESWVSRRRWKSGEVHRFLGPLRRIGGRSIGGLPPMGETRVVAWVDV